MLYMQCRCCHLLSNPCTPPETISSSVVSDKNKKDDSIKTKPDIYGEIASLLGFFFFTVYLCNSQSETRCFLLFFSCVQAWWGGGVWGQPRPLSWKLRPLLRARRVWDETQPAHLQVTPVCPSVCVIRFVTVKNDLFMSMWINVNECTDINGWKVC